MPLAKLSELYDRVSGRFKSSTKVNTWNRGQQVLRQFTAPSNPDSTDQQAVRTTFSNLTKNWKNLTSSQREDWDTWAATHDVINRLGNQVSRTGLSAYVELGSINFYRTAVLASAGPTLPQPAPPTAIALAAGQDGGGSLKITITHAVGSTAGLYVMARATAAISSPAITPKLTDYRMICGVNDASFQALTTSGSTYTFEGTRFSYNDNNLVGIEVQIVNSEGWASIPYRVVDDYQV